MKRGRVLVLLAGAALSWAAVIHAQAARTEHDGRYAGQIACDVLPGQTVQPLKTDFSMTVTGGQVDYQREILRPTSPGRLGVTERGGGTVSAGGEVALKGAASGQTWSYEATYTGRFEGKALRLSGAQLWRLPDRAPHSRPCTITVSRAE